jgi:spore maturation protein CgeB
MKRFTIFCHSLVSDWNHGNAHFLRGLATALLNRGHQVSVFEPRGSWSLSGLRAECGDAPLKAFEEDFPHLRSTEYDLDELDLDRELSTADVVLVHEWNDPELVRRIGEHRHARGGYTLLFHDTHHRSVTDPAAMAAYDLCHFDGVLAFGDSIRCRYVANNWARRVWTWHEAADTNMFYPREPESSGPRYDLVWIGNWGDDERAGELLEFLIGPVMELGLRACVYGVRYPAHALDALRAAGIEYRGWLPNARVPEVFAQARFTIHVPRRPYARALPGIPTIRVFEALACRIPLISAPWSDCERLFRPGHDFALASDGAEMKRRMRDVLEDPSSAQRRAHQGFESIEARHTCVNRVVELERICEELT